MLNLIIKFRWWLLLAVFVAWTLLIGKMMYDKGRGELSELQRKADVADQKNKHLAGQVIAANDKVFQIKQVYKLELDQWEIEHKDKLPEPASKCTGSDDYYGEKVNKAWLKKFDQQGEAMINE